MMVKYYHAGAMLVAKQESGVKTWFHGDHLGSVRVITSSRARR